MLEEVEMMSEGDCDNIVGRGGWREAELCTTEEEKEGGTGLMLSFSEITLY